MSSNSFANYARKPPQMQLDMRAISFAAIASIAEVSCRPRNIRNIPRANAVRHSRFVIPRMACSPPRVGRLIPSPLSRKRTTKITLTARDTQTLLICFIPSLFERFDNNSLCSSIKFETTSGLVLEYSLKAHPIAFRMKNSFSCAH